LTVDISKLSDRVLARYEELNKEAYEQEKAAIKAK